MSYFNIGGLSSLCLFACMVSCTDGITTVESPMATFEYRFVNETEHDVEYFGHMFEIPAGEERSREDKDICERITPAKRQPMVFKEHIQTTLLVSRVSRGCGGIG